MERHDDPLVAAGGTVLTVPAPGENADPAQQEVGAWAKRFHFAVRAATESVLRPYALGSTQWAVLHRLANHGPTLQRDLGRMLAIERATLSTIVGTLARKGLVVQVSGGTDQRQRMLELTESGAELWRSLPDPVAAIREIAFAGTDPADRAAALRVLKLATQQLDDHFSDR